MDGCVPVPVPTCRERFLEERVVVMGGERAAPHVDGLLCRCYLPSPPFFSISSPITQSQKAPAETSFLRNVFPIFLVSLPFLASPAAGRRPDLGVRGERA